MATKTKTEAAKTTDLYAVVETGKYPYVDGVYKSFNAALKALKDNYGYGDNQSVIVMKLVPAAKVEVKVTKL